jgi:hypothetical protein
MSEFDSSNFKKKIHNTPMREFNVGPPDGEYNEPTIEELKRNAQEVRNARMQNANKIGDLAKQRLEYLSNIGRSFKEVKIDGISFTLRTLKAKETKEAALATFSSSNNIAAAFEARKQQLARSLYKIDNQDLEFVLGKDDLETRLDFIEELEDVVVAALFNAFSELKDTTSKKFDIKNEEEAKEVVEDLKK